jgi:chemotaxis protein histidine kinase CheA
MLLYTPSTSLVHPKLATGQKVKYFYIYHKNDFTKIAITSALQLNSRQKSFTRYCSFSRRYRIVIIAVSIFRSRTMDDNKQQIVHYFIEEAQEHLEVVEQGLLDLGEVIKDADRVNELFRAAHSVKGGAAMLGFESIQKTAHELEDCFKVMRDHSVPVDQQLETMFLKGYDTLKALVAELAESPTLTLRPEIVDPIVQGSIANFIELKEYLNELLSMATVSPDTMPAFQKAPVVAVAVAAVANGSGAPTAVIAPPVNIAAKVMENLRAMLGSFKQGEATASRQQICSYCQNLSTFGEDAASWQNVVKIATQAINNSANTYEALAPVVIKDLKLAGDLLAAGRGAEASPSPALQELALASAPIIAPVAAAQIPVVASAPVAAPAQITIPVDSRAAAQAILRNFNRQQVTELVVLLHRAINTPKQN